MSLEALVAWVCICMQVQSWSWERNTSRSRLTKKPSAVALQQGAMLCMSLVELLAQVQFSIEKETMWEHMLHDCAWSHSCNRFWSSLLSQLSSIRRFTAWACKFWFASLSQSQNIYLYAAAETSLWQRFCLKQYVCLNSCMYKWVCVFEFMYVQISMHAWIHVCTNENVCLNSCMYK